MKKFISFVMAAAMTASMVPATVFASSGTIEATAKVIGAEELSETQAKTPMTGAGTPELQLKVTSAAYTTGETNFKQDITVSLDNAKFTTTVKEELAQLVKVGEGAVGANVVTKEASEDEVVYTIDKKLAKDDVIAFQLSSQMEKISKGKTATVSVESDLVDVDGLVYATVVGKGITASVKKMVDVAEEEVAKLSSRGLKIEKTATGSYEATDEFTLKLSKGFEFANTKLEETSTGVNLASWDAKDNTATFKANADDADMVLQGIKVEAVSAKTGAVATMTVKVNGSSDSVEVAKVVDYKVGLSVDEDADMPVIYSGVNVDNDGITDDSDHLSLEVTVEESFPGAWSMRQGFEMNLPEGVYVADVEVIDAENFFIDNDGVGVEAWDAAFLAAYDKGDFKGFTFPKRVFDDVNTVLADETAKVTFQLALVADPAFEGDVTLTLEGGLVDEQEIEIATFVKPYAVVAQQNDVIIDYRYTEVPTAIEITEAADGLWEKDASFEFSIEKDLLMFEEDPTIEADEKSGMELKDDKKTDKGMTFVVKSESDEAATVTITDMQLFMNRSIPAGPYALELESSLVRGYLTQTLHVADKEVTEETTTKKSDDKKTVADVTDYSEVVKEAFINVVTSGRDQDDASFTTKVVVPVGESYLMAGENKVELDVPAYITAAGYTMLPVRAVAKALGINNNSVMWSAEARTATILYGQRIITMTVGEKVVYVNGSAIPASSAVEISGDRAFLPMRDLATALGVTDITWDAATKTATLNGNRK